MSVVLLVRMAAKAGEEESLASLLRELGEASRQEPGCEHYIPSRGTDDPSAFVIYEQYADQAALDAHRASEHFQRLVGSRMQALLAHDRERTLFETL